MGTYKAEAIFCFIRTKDSSTYVLVPLSRPDFLAEQRQLDPALLHLGHRTVGIGLPIADTKMRGDKDGNVGEGDKSLVCFIQ